LKSKKVALLLIALVFLVNICACNYEEISEQENITYLSDTAALATGEISNDVSSKNESETLSDDISFNETESSIISEAEALSEADAISDSTQTVESEPEITSNDPLEFLNDPNYIYEPVSYETAYGIFSNINSLIDISDKIYNSLYFGAREKLLSFSSLGVYNIGVYNNGNYIGYYEIKEDYNVGKMYLILHDITDISNEISTVLAEKDTANNFDAVEIDYILHPLQAPYNLIDQEKLDKILEYGYVQPFLDNDFSFDSVCCSDDKMILSFRFYMLSKKQYVTIVENYTTGKMYYKFQAISDITDCLSGTYDGEVQLYAEANRDDYGLHFLTAPDIY
jgi:hypothetical protein